MFVKAVFVIVNHKKCHKIMIYRLQLKLILQSTYWCGRDACYRHPPATYNVQAHPWSRNMSLSNWVTASVQIEREGGGAKCSLSILTCLNELPNVVPYVGLAFVIC